MLDANAAPRAGKLIKKSSAQKIDTAVAETQGALGEMARLNNTSTSPRFFGLSYRAVVQMAQARGEHLGIPAPGGEYITAQPEAGQAA